MEVLDISVENSEFGNFGMFFVGSMFIYVLGELLVNNSGENFGVLFFEFVSGNVFNNILNLFDVDF